MEILVAGKSIQDVSAISRELAPVFAGICEITTIEALRSSLQPSTPLLIVDDYFLNLLSTHVEFSFLHDTPCLALLENTDQLPDTVKINPSIDFLATNSSPAILRQKVQFLLWVKTILTEKNNSAVRLNDIEQSIKENMSLLDALSTRDGLTGLFNRRYFNQTLRELFYNAVQEDRDLSLLLIDIDYFSQINKLHGHDYGDFVLNELAARITSVFRSEDIKCRFGGEDFSVLLPDTDLETAKEFGEQFRTECNSKPFNNGYLSIDITVSIGCISLFSSSPKNHDEFVTMTEMALFAAKSEGRNRLIDYQSTLGIKPHSRKRNFLALKNNLAKLLSKTKISTISSLQLLARDLACQDDKEHNNNISLYVQLLCANLHLPESVVTTFINAISLHTSIRCLLHSEIISKQDSLNDTERSILKEFPYRLTELTELFDYFAKERSVLLSYGERYDGSGYPDGLKGNEIPLGARVFNIVDSLAAMNADRPYRKKLAPQKIVEELMSGAGKQFDPFLVGQTFEIILQNDLLDIEPDIVQEAVEHLHQKFPEMFS